MLSFLKNFFYKKTLFSLWRTVEEINRLEERFSKLSDEELKEKSLKLKSFVREKIAEREKSANLSSILDSVLPEAFALVREAAKRTLGQRPFDVQLLGGIVLHKGAIAEMMTGEGKTLAAVAPAYLNALLGKGVHVVTVNEYLARRDTVWMGQIYHALGLSVACIVPNASFLYDPTYIQINEQQIQEKRTDEIDSEKLISKESALLDRERDTTGSFLVQKEFLRPISRRDAYLADVTYGTNHEFGFDYLRDNLAYSLTDRVQREHYYAIIDEVDSILIDEARTPLIIAAPDSESSEYYKIFAKIVSLFKKDEDYVVDEKFKSVSITEAGIEKTEKILGIKNLYAPENIRLVHYLEESLRARALFQRDRDYVVKNGEVLIVDEFTGRVLHGRRYSGGLHQAIEAKEGVYVKEESRTYAQISIQNYFRMYEKIAGMTGTAQTSAEEFYKVYNLEVISVPPNKPLIRKDFPDAIYKSQEAKWKAVVQEIKKRHQSGQPVLVGTTSIEKNEFLSGLLKKEGIPHEVLNAKNNEREGAIIAQAGRKGAVTVATNMAGRGVDIILGGNPPLPEEAEEVRKLGGLHVIGTERHEARRIDNQLRGRAGRQGDPGSSQFFLSVEDDLIRIFGGDKLKKLMERFNLPDDQPIQIGFVSKVVAEAQAKVEGANFDLRKHLLEYDDVLNKQRSTVYKRRKEILESFNKEELARIIFEISKNALNKIVFSNFKKSPEELDEKDISELKTILRESAIIEENAEISFSNLKSIIDALFEKSKKAAADSRALGYLLSILDSLWMNHLEDLEALADSVRLRAYGQKDPLVEYRNEARHLYANFWDNFNMWVFLNIFRLTKSSTNSDSAEENSAKKNLENKSGTAYHLSVQKVGRNDPCPCGSGKKYKKCHGG